MYLFFLVFFVYANTQIVNAQIQVTLEWPFNQGPNNQIAANISVDEIFSLSSYTYGDNLTLLAATRSREPYTFSQFQPTQKNTTHVVGDEIVFRVSPRKGIKFTPTRLTFAATKFGTSGCDIDVSCRKENGDEIALITKYNIERDGTDPHFTEFDIAVNDITVEGESFIFTVTPYNLANNKVMGLSSFVLYGTYEGEAIEVPSYTLTAVPADKNAGNVIINPSSDKYDEGTLITLTATENFGYHFEQWEDATGNIVSTNNPYSIEIDKDVELLAVYSKNNIYKLSLSYSDGVNSNLVSVSPTGTLIDGQVYYEEGTEVALTAINNPIFSFTNWSDNTTAATKYLVMTQDVDLTAQFSNRDYIVGWDFYLDNPNNSRPADYKSASDNAGLFVLKNSSADYTWLAKGVVAGKYNDMYCVVNWRPFRVESQTDGDVLSDDERCYYEISFSTKGYTNIEVLATMGLNFNAFSVQLVEYSLDGTNYTKVGEIVIPDAKIWKSESIVLPELCDNKDKVYVRFHADMSSAIKGTATGVDGTCITDIFVLAEEEHINDNEAPVLVGSNPQNNEIGISASGSIILTFDERVIEGTGDCILNNEVLKANFSGKNVILPYNGLSYNTSYSITIPQGKILDRSGNSYEGTTISFTTMERTQPLARLYDFIVATDETGDFASIQSAIDAAPANQVRPFLIFIKNGVYKEHINIPENKPFLHFIGQDVEKVKITDDRLSGSTGDSSIPTYHVSEGATVVCQASNILFENIIFENSWGVEKNDGPQALALYTNNDRIVLNNCKMLSYQDTWLTSTKSITDRQYAKNCWIEGAVDFIYGAGDVYFDECTINIVRPTGGYIVAPNHKSGTQWGYVFMNNTITTTHLPDPSSYSVWLGRPWHNSPKTVFINTIAEVTIPAAGWYQTMGGLPELWAEYNTMDKNGNPVDLSNRNTYYYRTVDGVKEEHWTEKAVLTDEEATQYTIKNVLSGSDNWEPALMTEACDMPNATIASDKIVWNAVDYAICYVITCDEKIIGFTTDCEYTMPQSGSYKVQSVNEFGGLSKAATVVPTSIESVDRDVTVVSELIFTIDGIRMKTLQQGINIVRSIMSDGTVKTEKVFIR